MKVNSKLIKLSNAHYIIVDDSEMKEGNFVIEFINNKPTNILQIKGSDFERCIHNYEKLKKITHSTPIGGLAAMLETGVKEISLSEVEEAINDYIIDQLVEVHINTVWGKYKNDLFKHDDIINDKSLEEISEYDYKAGFNAHKNLTKDKVFTVDDFDTLVLNLLTFVSSNSIESKKEILDNFKSSSIQYKSLLPKTEWNITITANNKIKLK